VRNTNRHRGTLPEKKHFTEKSYRHHYDVFRSGDVITHQEHAHTIAHGHFPIGCRLEPSNLASFPRYLAPKLRQRLLRDAVINDVMRPGSIREEHINIPYVEHCRRSSRRVGRRGQWGAHDPPPLSSSQKIRKYL